MIKQILKNPYIIASIIFFILSIAILDILRSDDYSNELVISSLLGVFTLLLTSFLVINAIKQNEISKRNIKLQLFDKRYKIFKAIVNSNKIITERDHSNYIISNIGDNTNFINKKIIDSANDMYDVAILSQAVFDDNLASKITKAAQKYKKVCDLHFDIIKQHISLSEDIEFGNIFKASLLATTDAEKIKYNDIINKKFPNFQSKNQLFDTETTHYTEWIKESNILNDFDKYLKINELNNV